jgi:dihydrodipicolinate synthase/N-acetylneuraminate lyase
MQTLFAETNPAPIKEALYLAGLIERADLRLPLVRVRPATVARLREALSAQGIKLERGW